MRELHAVVIGAGVAGITAAVGLAQLGHDVRVLERSSRVDPNGAALGLWPAAQEGLEQLGVFQRLAGECVPYRHGTVRDRSGGRLADLPLARIERQAGRPVVLVSRPALMRALTEHLAEVSRVPVELDARAPLAEMLDGGADLVVGADGIGSSIRRYVAPAARPPRPLHATAWRGSCDGTEPMAGEIWGDGVLAGVTAAGPEATNWYVAVHDRHAVASLDDLRALLTGWPAPLGAVMDRTKDSDVLRHEIFDLPPLTNYVRGRVGLVGDAAHAMTPSLGQGACQAMLDSLSLVRHVRDAEEVATALHGFDAERRPAGNRFVRGSRALTRVQFAAPGLEAVRNLVVGAGSRLVR